MRRLAFRRSTRSRPPTSRKLALAFTFSTATTHGYEAPPLVVERHDVPDHAFPNDVYALDLTKPGAPPNGCSSPSRLAARQGVACCDIVNRGAVYSNGKIIFNTLDGQTIAVDADSGQQVWRTQLGDIQKGETITMAPLVAGGKVLVGNSGGEMGVRGWLAALDEGSGKLVWKALQYRPRQGRPDRPRFKPFYATDQGKDLGVKTWPPEAWKIGGGTVWGWLELRSRSSTSSITAPPIPVRGIPTSGPATTSGRPACSPATSIPARRSGITRSSPHDLFDHAFHCSAVSEVCAGSRGARLWGVEPLISSDRLETASLLGWPDRERT